MGLFIVMAAPVSSLDLPMYFDGFSYSVEISTAKVYQTEMAAAFNAELANKVLVVPNRYHDWDAVEVEIKVKES